MTTSGTTDDAEGKVPRLEKTPLHALHVELGARMVAFAGYEMPVSYPLGVLKEHLWTRQSAGLFDVSHMGQAFVMGFDHDQVAGFLETILPGDIAGLRPGQIRYSVMLNERGGIIDDLMVTRSASEADDGSLMLVLNASRKGIDLQHIADLLPEMMNVAVLEDRALLALQGPKAEAVLARHCPDAARLSFMTAATSTFDGIDCHVARCGYTGEDGFEISVAAEQAEQVARLLLDHGEVEAIGLGARDSLRLEAGLCLYGQDIDETTTPVEADLAWVIGRRRREKGGFAGAEIVLRQLAEGPARRRVGLVAEGKAPVRAGAALHAQEDGDAVAVGRVTSGGFGPSVGAPVAMGYVTSDLAVPGARVFADVRGKRLAMTVTRLPFVTPGFKR